MSRLIDAEFEENHYSSMLLNPTPDVAEQDKRNARIIIDALRMAKTVEPKRGRWIHDGSKWKNRWICSECGYKWFFDCIEGAYCPNCGSDMREVTT